MRRTLRRLCPSATTFSKSLEGLLSKISERDTVDDLPSLWTEMEGLQKTALSLRETDSLLAIANCVLDKTKVSPDGAVWAWLFRTAKWSDIEASSVLEYGKMTETPLTSSTEVSVGGSSGVPRDLLWVTGGIVPVTQRKLCATGLAHYHLLKRWVALQPRADGGRPEMDDTLAFVVVESLQDNASSLTEEALSMLVPLLLSHACSSEVDSRLFQLLESLDAAHTCAAGGTSDDGSARRSVAVSVAVAASQSLFVSHESIQSFLTLERAYRLFNVTRKCYHRTHPGSTSVAAEVERLAKVVDLAVQTNENANNPLGLDADVLSTVRNASIEAVLHCQRVERTVDDFPRHVHALLEREGMPLSFSLQHEVVLWYAQRTSLMLLDDRKSHESETVESSLNECVLALRTLVDIRPRGDAMDPESQLLYQHAHREVLKTLCATHSERWISEAYIIVVTHKYHQLSVDVPLVRELLRALSKRGDGRVFNLVDLVTLYAGNTIDFETIECLFKACAVAGDHHRARALYNLLKDAIPGFLVKAPHSIGDALRELKVLAPVPGNMFDVSGDARPLVSLAQRSS